MTNSTRRRTKIIATLGPATHSPEMIEQLIKAGMNVARLNMSHAKHATVEDNVRSIREISKRLDVPVAILMDTQGPAIRTGDLSSALTLTPGQRIALTVRGEKSEEEFSVDVNYDHLVDDIRVDDIVLVDNGTIQLRVLEKKHNQLACVVLTPGVLGSRRHINLPGVRVNLPALTDKDIEDVELGVRLGVDYFAMSFVREPEDVLRLRAILDYRKSNQRIIAKLEDQEGVRNLDAIIKVADGVMVARGDLGIECPYEELPIIQRRIVKHCIRFGKPVIVATHMLESMIENPSPTRAEITDVANAVYEQADAIMLSGETTVGKYPVRCVELMARVAARIESSGGAGYASEAILDSDYARLVKSASVLATEVKASALIVFTQTGTMARAVSWLRPMSSPIYAFTGRAEQVNQLALHWGVLSFHMPGMDAKNVDVESAIDTLKQRGLLKAGDTVVTVAPAVLRGKTVETVQLEQVS